MMGWIYDKVMEFRRRKYKLHTESKFMKACYTYCTVQCQPDKYDDAFFTGKKRQLEKKMYCIISRSEQRLYIFLYFLQTGEVVFQPLS